MSRGARIFLRTIWIVALVVVIALATTVGYLVTANAKPRTAEGWTRLPDMPRPRGEGAVGVLQAAGAEQLVVAGGIGGLGRTARDVWRFYPDDNRWLRGPDLPARRHHAAAAGLNGVLYVSGGSRQTTNWKPETNVWALAQGSQRWERLPPMPEGRMAHQMAAVNGRLYVIGGRGGSATLVYEPQTGRWTRVAPIPQPRDHLAAVVVGTRIWAIGGRDADVRRRVDVYDTQTDGWSPGPDLPIPMSAMGAGLLEDGIHVVGGEDPATFGGGVIDRHLTIDPNAPAATWREAGRPILAVHGAASGIVFGKLVMAGGSRRQGTFSVLGWTGLTQAFG